MAFLLYPCQDSNLLKLGERFDSWPLILSIDVGVTVVAVCEVVVMVVVEFELLFWWCCGMMFFVLVAGVCLVMHPLAISISWKWGTSSLHCGGSCDRSSIAKLIGEMISENSYIHFLMNSGRWDSFSIPYPSFLNWTTFAV